MSFRVLIRRAGSAASSAASPCWGSGSTMPLRAKIPARGVMRAQMSTNTAKIIPKELDTDEPHDVLFNNLYGLRTIELNRPSKLNSLNGSMIRKIFPRLFEWEKSDMANVIVIKGAGDKAFCAGGDVADLATQNKEDPDGLRKSTEYFAQEYKLDHYIATYRKPYIAFMDGFTMGGGVGLSIHAPFRIATERTVFAMPETNIGFFPDVGGSFFLPRMPGALGTYLGLTSSRLIGANVFYSGIATHYLHSTSLPSLESRLAELRFRDHDSMRDRLAIIEMTIEEYATGLPHDVPILLRGELRKAIDRCFSKDTVEDIMDALRQEQGPTQSWAESTLETLHQRSPTSVYVALRQMREGRNWSISETFQKEYQMAAKFMKHPDFNEGVTALLISKEKPPPKWQPARLEDIEPRSDIDPFFEKSEEDTVERLDFVVDRDYNSYPYESFGVPTELDVQTVVMRNQLSRHAIREEFIRKKKGRQGIGAIVGEILARKTIVNEDGKAEWVDE